MKITPGKIIFLDHPHPSLPQKLADLGFTCVFDFESPKDKIAANLPDFQGLVLRSRFALDRHFIQCGANLKFIAREGVGLEHIDIEFAESVGIRILASPEGSRDTVGEHAIGLLLSLLNNLSRADRQVRQGQWIREGNRGVELKGKTVGILGYGNMGGAFARRLQGFEVKTLAYDRYKTGFGDDFAQEASLEQIWTESDILSLHFPYSTDNHYFVNDAFFQNFSKNVFLVNTARGLILNTEDLVANLKSGKVRGAALDVLEYEEVSFNKFRLDSERLPPAFHYLMEAENVVLTPHVAGWSFESKEKHGLVLAEKISLLLAD